MVWVMVNACVMEMKIPASLHLKHRLLQLSHHSQSPPPLMLHAASSFLSPTLSLLHPVSHTPSSPALLTY
jgi:hypothetical protein